MENKEVKKRILNDPVTYSEKFSENAKSICEGLLAKAVDARLGFKNGSCDELRSHPFFSELNWRKLDAGADANVTSLMCLEESLLLSNAAKYSEILLQ